MDKRRARATLAASCTIHFLHDGCSDLLYPLFPVWAREFSLSFAQVGLLRTGYSGALALFQVPAGFLAERWGEPRVLAVERTTSALEPTKAPGAPGRSRGTPLARSGTSSRAVGKCMAIGPWDIGPCAGAHGHSPHRWPAK